MEDKHVEPETLGAYAEGRLPAGDAAAVEAHASVCAECLGALAAIGAAGELARFAAPLEPRLARKLEGLAPPRTPSRGRRRAISDRHPRSGASGLRTALTVAGLVVALVGGAFVFTPASKVPVQPDDSAPTASPTPASHSPAHSPTAPTPAPSRSPQAVASPAPTPPPELAPQLDVPEPQPTESKAPVPPVPATPDTPGSSAPPPETITARPDASPAPPAADARPVDVELAQGSCTLAKKSLRAGERATVRPGDELAASSGARLLVHGSELYLRGSAALEETREGEAVLVAARVRSGELLLSVAGTEGAPRFEVRAGTLRGRPQPGGRTRVLCSLAADRSSVAAVEGSARAGEGAGELSVELATGQQVVARKGARGALKPEAARGASWVAALGPRESLVYRATFESSADGWDEEERVSPGFGGSSFGLKAVPSGAGQPWRFLALRTRPELDPAVHAIRFRFRTPLPGEPIMVTVLRVGVAEQLVAVVRPPSAKDTWALFDLKLSSFGHEAGPGNAIGLGADRKAKVIVQQGTDHDPVAADFVIDDFEILERAN